MQTGPACRPCTSGRRAGVVGVAAGEERAAPGRRRDGRGHRAAHRRARARAPRRRRSRSRSRRSRPKLTTEEAVKKGPLMTRLGTWKTWFPVSDHNFFGANIWRPAQIIDGTVLLPRPALRVVERDRAGDAQPRVRARRVHRRRPHRADRRARRRDVLELDDAVQRRAARRPADGRPVESQVLHQPLSAGPRRHGVKMRGRRRPDDVVHQRHEAPDRHPRASATRRAASAGSGTRSGASRTAGR